MTALSRPDAPLLAPHLPEAEEDRLPVLVPVPVPVPSQVPTTPAADATAAGGAPVSLFLGNQVAAADGALLLSRGITSTLNLAVNVEMAPLVLADGTRVRRSQVGLIDGPGNTPAHLLGAALVVAGILAQASPGKPHYPPHRPGGLLVHCRGGRSRSVATLALHLVLAHPAAFASLDEALAHLRRLRGLPAHQPTEALCALARAAHALAARPQAGMAG